MKLSQMNCSRGAPMGRFNHWVSKLTDKVHLQRVRLDSGGYDNGGAYWGIGGEPLYHAWTDPDDPTNELYVFVRAGNREEAKKGVLKYQRDAKFFR